MFVSPNHNTESYLPPPQGHEVPEDSSLANVYHKTPGDIASWVDIDFNSNALAHPKDDFKAEADRYAKMKATRRVLHTIGQKMVWQEDASSRDHTYVQDTSNNNPVIICEIVGEFIRPDVEPRGRKDAD